MQVLKKMTLSRLFVIISLRKTNEGSLNEQDDYGVPVSEQQYTHCYVISLCLNTNPLINLPSPPPPPPESPQILAIYSLVVL